MIFYFKESELQLLLFTISNPPDSNQGENCFRVHRSGSEVTYLAYACGYCLLFNELFRVRKLVLTSLRVCVELWSQAAQRNKTPEEAVHSPSLP